MAAEKGIEAGLVDRLLALQTRKQRTELLRDAGLLNVEGLDGLLDTAEQITRSDPGRAQRLAALCTEVAKRLGDTAIVPRADYLRAQTCVANGEFDTALRLIEAARDSYLRLGMDFQALRTNAGRMHTLIEVGRYDEALRTGQVVFDALAGDGTFAEAPTRQQAESLAAPIHQNQGLCYEFIGRYDLALEAYERAERHYRSLGMTERVGEILDNRGVVLSYLGRGNEALECHEAAAAIFSAEGLTLSYAMSLDNIGETYLWLGDYTKSLRAFEQARRWLNDLDAHAVKYFLLRNTADTYLALNLYAEALASYREADGLLRGVGMEHDHARALWGMGSALIASSELKKAQAALAEAAGLFRAAGNTPMLSGVMLEQAALLEAQNENDAALVTAREALDLVLQEDWPVQEIYARLRVADLLLPDAARATPHLMAARRLVAHLALPQLRYRLNERLGHLRLLQDRFEEARTLLEEAVDEIERLRGAVAQDAMRASFLRDKTAAYADLLLLHLIQDDDEGDLKAFTVAERAKSRALVDLLTGVAEKEPPKGTDPDSERRIRTLQADLNGVYGELLGGWGDGERPTPVPTLRARAFELEQEISRLRLQSAAVGAAPDPFEMPLPSDDVRDLMPSDTVLLAYHTVGDEILAFVIVGGRVQVARHLGTEGHVERLLHRLDIQWDRFRAGQEFAERHMVALERSTRQVLAALYEELVKPLEPLLREAISDSVGAGSVPKLSVVPHGALHRVPFHALFDGDRYLIERFEVSYAPSATVYALCQEREPPDMSEAAVFGVEDPLTPAATAEARTVAGHLAGAAARVGDDATLETLREEASRSGILHLACHGLFRSDNPMFSALKLHDGWLTAADATSLDLPGALVTLSACESGRAEVIGGDEVLGLTRAFLGAGAATLVVSLWLVQDETTAELMGNWYGRLRAGERRASALRAAQLDLKERHPHPYYWAPFVLIGKR